MRHLRLLIVSWLCLAAPVAAQHQDAIFRDYKDMREVLDRMMMNREIENVMRAFGASDEMTDEQLRNLEMRVRDIFPYDFRHVDVLKVDDMSNGWKRELYAYWAGTAYIYATVLYHQREGELISISFQFNTDIDELIAAF